VVGAGGTRRSCCSRAGWLPGHDSASGPSRCGVALRRKPRSAWSSGRWRFLSLLPVFF